MHTHAMKLIAIASLFITMLAQQVRSQPAEALSAAAQHANVLITQAKTASVAFNDPADAKEWVDAARTINHAGFPGKRRRWLKRGDTGVLVSLMRKAEDPSRLILSVEHENHQDAVYADYEFETDDAGTSLFSAKIILMGQDPPNGLPNPRLSPHTLSETTLPVTRGMSTIVFELGRALWDSGRPTR
jgi:hypothetical protein